MYIKAVKCGNASTLEAGSSSMEVQGQPVLQMGWECIARSWEGGRKVERTVRITETQLPWAPLTSDHICLKVSTGIHTCPLVYLTCLPLTSLVPYLSTFQPTIPILKTAKVFKDIYFQTKIISSWQSIKLFHKKKLFLLGMAAHAFNQKAEDLCEFEDSLVYTGQTGPQSKTL